jgi:hypothetical protein
MRGVEHRIQSFTSKFRREYDYKVLNGGKKVVIELLSCLRGLENHVQ